MLFSAVAEGRILRYDPARGKASEFRKYTNRTNGLAFAPGGALYGCQESSRRVIRFAEDGSTTTTAFLLDGSYHNHPNNLAIDSKGRIWFSDPWSELRASGPQIFPALSHASVLRLELDPFRKLWSIRRMTYDTAAPRAVALSPDESTLYVAETDNAPAGRRELRAYPILSDDTLGAFAVASTAASRACAPTAKAISSPAPDGEKAGPDRSCKSFPPPVRFSSRIRFLRISR